MPLQPGTRLHYALQRSSSRGVQIAGTMIVAGVLAAVVVVIVKQGERTMPFLIVGGLFGLASLSTMYAAIHQAFAMKTPQTTIEVDREVFTRGKEIQLYILQRGPASLASLRAELVGEEWWLGPHKRQKFS